MQVNNNISITQMKDLKDRWQLITGFVAVIISLSSYKDELKEISLDYYFINFNLSEYLFYVIIGFIVVIHLYIIPYILNSTKYSKIKLLKGIENLTYVIFLIIVLSPTFLFFIYIIKLFIVELIKLEEQQITKVMRGISFLSGILTYFLIRNLIKNYKELKKIKEENQSIQKEIQNFEISKKLLNEGYYNQSIFESAKIIEEELNNNLKNQDLIYGKVPISKLILVAEKKKLYDNEILNQINELRIKRNEIAHKIDIVSTKEEAEKFINLAKKIISFHRQ